MQIFKSTQTWLKCRSGEKTEAWRKLFKIQRKNKAKRGVIDLEGKLVRFGDKQLSQYTDSWSDSNPYLCL